VHQEIEEKGLVASLCRNVASGEKWRFQFLLHELYFTFSFHSVSLRSIFNPLSLLSFLGEISVFVWPFLLSLSL